MAEVLGDLPLALEQAAGYLDQNHIPLTDYLRLLQGHLDEMIDKGSVAGHEHTLASVWKLSTDRLRAENPAAVQILGICSYLAPEPIPLDLFTANADELPAPLAEVTADPTKWEHSVGALVNYALVRRTTDGTNSITVHRLIQATTRREHAAQTPLTSTNYAPPFADCCPPACQWKSRQLQRTGLVGRHCSRTFSARSPAMTIWSQTGQPGWQTVRELICGHKARPLRPNPCSGVQRVSRRQTTFKATRSSPVTSATSQVASVTSADPPRLCPCATARSPSPKPHAASTIRTSPRPSTASPGVFATSGDRLRPCL